MDYVLAGLLCVILGIVSFKGTLNKVYYKGWHDGWDNGYKIASAKYKKEDED